MYSRKPQHPLWLLTGFWICVLISVAVVIRRLIALEHPSLSGPPQMAQLDAVFSSHATLMIAHIIPALVFVLLAVGVLLLRRPSKWIHQLFFPFGAITGLTAYAMSRYAIGGWVERSAVLVFDTWFLFSLGCAYRFYHRGQPVKQREWTTRAVGILLGIATTRPVMGVFFASSGATHLTAKQFFGIAFWIGFSINVVVIELWLHSNQRLRVMEPIDRPQANTQSR